MLKLSWGLNPILSWGLIPRLRQVLMGRGVLAAAETKLRCESGTEVSADAYTKSMC